MIAAVAIAGIVSGIILWINIPEQKKNKLITSYEGLWVNDTLISYEFNGGQLGYFSSIHLINQIAEGLFEIDVTDETSHIIPNLALNGTWSSDGLNFTCILRQGVKFHDGTPFNATAVKWNFDRLHNLLDYLVYPWIWYDADLNLILNRTEIVDNYIVRFVLNKPFVPFKAMLTSLQSYILSPRAVPLNNFSYHETGLIGTGPFKYDSSTILKDPTYLIYYTENTTLIANPDYWGEKPYLEKLIFKYFQNPDDHVERYEQMIEGKIDYTYLWPWGPENYTDSPEITLHYHNTSAVNYIWMNNNIINTTMRQAISYAFNYSKMLTYEEQWWEGGVIRCRSPLSKGMLYSNWEDFDLPYYNLTHARQVLKDVNWNGTAGSLTANDNISAGNEWESLVTNETPLAIYNYTYGVASDYSVFYKDLIVESLKQIGVELNIIPLFSGEGWKIHAWSAFWISGWYPDYFDPSSNVNPLFSSKIDGFENWGNVNDTLAQQWMDDAIIETNEIARGQLYYNIQKRLIEEVYPVIWTYTEGYCAVHGPKLTGINYYLAPYKMLFKYAHF